MQLSKIRKVFIANRGEICRRLAIGAKGLGLQTASVWQTAGDPPRFLSEVIDQFARVETLDTRAYLNQDLMIQLAKETGADAIHPGYGFLSENADFADRVCKAGLIWIGPNSKSMRPMASKASARAIALGVGAPCIEGLQDLNLDQLEEEKDRLFSFAKKQGYPLLVKAAMGGGGKGMRLVEKESELLNAVARASSEAVSAFGDGQVIVEKYLTNPRHVEIQILADQHQQVFAIGDRDCSVQRRHQKIIEEAPAPGLSQATRDAMRKAACAIAAAVGYDSAGTIEFLVDWSEASQKKDLHDFFFLEMNTRLQVEHPVTEEAYGIDLVAWQIAVAEGVELPPHFASLPASRHAIEVRLYAEDCENQFLPAPGPVANFVPSMLPGVRWDIGIDAQDKITANFDPMITKVIATAQDRPAALRLMSQVIQKTTLLAEKHNFQFCRMIIEDPSFSSGPVSTKFLDEKYAELIARLTKEKLACQPIREQLLSSLANGELGLNLKGDVATPSTQSIAAFAYQNNLADTRQPSATKCDTIVHCEQLVALKSQPRQNWRFGYGDYQTSKDKHQTFAYALGKGVEGKDLWLFLDGFCERRQVAHASLQQGSQESVGGGLKAPVPGKVVSVHVQTGSEVSEKQTLVVLESMKMEFEVKAVATGMVEQVLVNVGDQVEAGQELLQWAELS